MHFGLGVFSYTSIFFLFIEKLIYSFQIIEFKRYFFFNSKISFKLYNLEYKIVKERYF